MPVRPPAAARRAAVGLVVACHPLPCLAVTVFAAAYARAVGLSAPRVALLAAAVLTGQLSVGWCNDAIDAPLDVVVARPDKPIATGRVSRATVGTAAALAVAACGVCSLALGVVPGLVHLTAVAAGWAYDLGLKSTAASGIAYVVAFGLLPAVATTALVQPHWPAPTVMVGAALLGLAAHFANTVGDAAADAVTGVRGLPQRLGPHRSLQVTALGVGTAALVLLAGVLDGAGRPRAVGVELLGVGLLGGGAVVALAGLVFARPGRARPGGAGARLPTGRIAFRLTLGAVALVVLGLLLAGPAASATLG
jgi:4-hydroxybenzoate polyprenyltransferase